MAFNEEDFTEKNYRVLLRKITNQTIFYDEIDMKTNFTLWRHDIDFSINRALCLAKIEKEENIKATYFLQLGSMFYNIFEQTIKEKILTIKLLGHKIALHFDPRQYNITSKIDFEKYLLYEKQILENLFDIKIDVFSFHNPTPEILKYSEWRYAGMINTYATYFKENIEYCSDSNGYWRHKRLETFLEEKYHKIQVLTHPAWWQKDIMSPYDRIKRSVDGRAIGIIEQYQNNLKKYGRANIE